MRSLVAVTVSLWLGFCPVVALAENCREPIAMTQPCEGVLLPPAAAAEGLRCLEVDLPKLQLEFNREREICKIKLDAMELKFNIMLKHNKQLELLLRESLDVETGPKAFWDSNVFWAVAGFFLGSLTTVGITFAVAEAVK